MSVPQEIWARLMLSARRFIGRRVGYTFTASELQVLQSFFTNTDRKVFYMHSLPANVMATLGSMFSRIQNPRGIRGVFVDAFLPALLAAHLREVRKRNNPYDGNPDNYLKEKGIKNLDQFISSSAEAKELYLDFVKNACLNPKYVKRLADSRRAKRFLQLYLDLYGHNSIARMGMVWVCFEGISLHAAKTLEWARPGVGFVELSTRYVSMLGASLYPIWNELAVFGADSKKIKRRLVRMFHYYRTMAGDNLDGIFPRFLRERYGNHFVGDQRDLDLGVSGETFDTISNMLPLASLTSVCAAIGGESYASICRHLQLDQTPENQAILELMLQEGEKIGADQFARHYAPTKSQRIGWEYLSIPGFRQAFPRLVNDERSSASPVLDPNPSHDTELLLTAFRMISGFEQCRSMEEVAEILFGDHRTEFDKLPSVFEAVALSFGIVISMRSWRDLHRQGFAAHMRTLLTPFLGFFLYRKPHPVELDEAFGEVADIGQALYLELEALGVPAIMLQFVLPIGFRIGATYNANLRQHEFVNWQRGKFAVNDEVRQVVLVIEQILRKHYPWWSLVSRSDTTPAYLFARGKQGIPLELDQAA